MFSKYPRPRPPFFFFFFFKASVTIITFFLCRRLKCSSRWLWLTEHDTGMYCCRWANYVFTNDCKTAILITSSPDNNSEHGRFRNTHVDLGNYVTQNDVFNSELPTLTHWAWDSRIWVVFHALTRVWPKLAALYIYLGWRSRRQKKKKNLYSEVEK